MDLSGALTRALKPATLDDIPRLVEMGRDFHAAHETRFPFSAEDTAKFFRGMIENPASIVLMTDEGFICGVISGQPSNASFLVAYEMFWWAEDGRGKELLSGFEKQARAMGAVAVDASHPADNGSADVILRRQGYEPETSVKRKVLKCA